VTPLTVRRRSRSDDRAHGVALLELQSGDAAVDPQRSVSGVLAVLQIHRLEARLMAALVGG
jgi:hypothetical protein